MSLVTQPPGIATPLHRHTKEAEAVFVLGGQIEYRAGDGRRQAYEPHAGAEGVAVSLSPADSGPPARVPDPGSTSRPGSSVSPHPAALMGLYDEVGVPAAGMHIPAEGEGRSMEEEIARWNEVGPRYGLQVVGPPLPWCLGSVVSRLARRTDRWSRAALL